MRTKEGTRKKKTSFYFYLDLNILEHTHLTNAKNEKPKKMRTKREGKKKLEKK